MWQINTQVWICGDNLNRFGQLCLWIELARLNSKQWPGRLRHHSGQRTSPFQDGSVQLLACQTANGHGTFTNSLCALGQNQRVTNQLASKLANLCCRLTLLWRHAKASLTCRHSRWQAWQRDAGAGDGVAALAYILTGWQQCGIFHGLSSSAQSVHDPAALIVGGQCSNKSAKVLDVATKAKSACCCTTKSACRKVWCASDHALTNVAFLLALAHARVDAKSSASIRHSARRASGQLHAVHAGHLFWLLFWWRRRVIPCQVEINVTLVEVHGHCASSASRCCLMIFMRCSMLRKSSGLRFSFLAWLAISL